MRSEGQTPGMLVDDARRSGCGMLGAVSEQMSSAAVTAGDEDLELARSGDDAAFTRLVAPLRAQLRAHCYRMLGSIHDADDAMQDALLRAWRGIDRFEGRSSFGSWLYTVATRTCLDTIEHRGRRALPIDLGPSSEQVVVADVPLTEISWLDPYPTSGLETIGGPDEQFLQRQSVELAFVAALQHLPANQRAALLLFDVLCFSAAEIATSLGTSTASVNSALQRARRVVAERVPEQSQQKTLQQTDDVRLSEIVAGFSSAIERGDVAALVALLTHDVTWSMPPMGHWYRGLDAVTDFAVQVPFACGSWQHVATSANSQPAVACYLRPAGSAHHVGWSINVLTLREDRICDVTSFIGSRHFVDFGLPTELAIEQR